jgi:Protein of unknown function (DUF2829)
MLFMEALANVIEGKYLTRNAWDVTGEYIILLPGMPYIWKILTQPQPNAGTWTPLVADLDADDWKIVPCDRLKASTEVILDQQVA